MNPKLLESTSPKLAALEALLAPEPRKPARPFRRGMRLCADGRKRPAKYKMGIDELHDWFWSCAYKAESGCWLFQVGSSDTGYRIIRMDSQFVGAHRIAARYVLGIWPEKWVLHSCDVRNCVNPNHLFLGDRAVNVDDALRKNRFRGRFNELNPNAKLSWETVQFIRNSQATCKALAEQFGVDRHTISAVKRNLAWTLNIDQPKD